MTNPSIVALVAPLLVAAAPATAQVPAPAPATVQAGADLLGSWTVDLRR